MIEPEFGDAVAIHGVAKAADDVVANVSNQVRQDWDVQQTEVEPRQCLRLFLNLREGFLRELREQQFTLRLPVSGQGFVNQ